MIIFTKLLLYLGLLLLFGGVLARRFLTPLFPPTRLLWLGLVLLLVGAGLSAWWPLYQFGYTSTEDVLEYLTGVTAGRAALSVVMGACVLLAAELSKMSLLAVFGGGMVVLWGIAGIGHGAAHGEQIRALHTLHALTMTVWLGGLLSLSFAPLAANEKERQQTQYKRWALFSPVALSCAVLIVLTGSVMALNHAEGVQTWLGSSYGRVLWLKIALVALTFGFAYAARKKVQQKQNPQLLVWFELGFLLLVLLVTAVLGQLPAPAHPA